MMHSQGKGGGFFIEAFPYGFPVGTFDENIDGINDATSVGNKVGTSFYWKQS